MNPYLLGSLIAREKYAMEKHALLPLAGVLGSALFGGALQGGLNTYMAPQGQKLESGLKGFGWGTLGGGLASGAFKGIQALKAMPGVQNWLSKPMSGAASAGRWLATKATGGEGRLQLGIGSLLPSGLSQPKPQPQPMTNIPWMQNG